MDYHLESYGASPWQMRALDVSSWDAVLQVLAFAIGIGGLGHSRGGEMLTSWCIAETALDQAQAGTGQEGEGGAGLPPAGLLWPSF